MIESFADFVRVRGMRAQRGVLLYLNPVDVVLHIIHATENFVRLGRRPELHIFQLPY